jgi:hypothetical protein
MRRAKAATRPGSPPLHIGIITKGLCLRANDSRYLCLMTVAGSAANYDGEFLSLMAQANKHMRAAQDVIDQILTNV